MNLKVFSEGDFPNYLPKLNALYDELFSGGKGFRSHLIQMVAKPLTLEDKTIHLLCQTIEFIHNASLLHDDLIDRSVLRRGKPAAWTRYTPEYAVLAGDYLLARVMVNLSSHGNLKLVSFTSQTISDLLEGEWIQDSLVGEINLDLDQLTRVHQLKTASLFKWCLRSPFLAKEEYDESVHSILDEMGGLLGVLFQRSDDLLDFDVRNAESKAVLGDLRSGYVNSFAAYVFADLDPETRNKAFASTSLGEFFNSVGRPLFDSKVKDFDIMNTELIDLYNHNLKMLKGKLDLPEDFYTDLERLPTYLYWRRKD